MHARSRPYTIPLVLGYLVVAGGAISFLGWCFHVPRLIDWIGDGISIKTNSAICAMLSGLALVLAAHRTNARVVNVAGIVVTLIAGLTLLEHATHWSLGLDTLLFDEAPGAAGTAAPNRMGVPASVSFLLLGAAIRLSCGTPRSKRRSAHLGLAACGLAALPLIGYLYGADKLYSLPTITGIAFQTAIMILALGVGFVLLERESGFSAMLNRRDAGGILFRRLVATVILVPLVIGWLRLQGQLAGYYDTAFGVAGFALSLIIIMLCVVWWTAQSISRSAEDDARTQAVLHESEGKFRLIFQTAPLGITLSKLVDGTIVDANQALLHLLGFRRDEVIGRTSAGLGIIRDAEARTAHVSQPAATGQVAPTDVELRRRDGTTLSVEVRAQVIDIAGEALIMSIIEDISERKRREADIGFLNEVSEALADSSDPDATVRGLCARIGAYFKATVCAFSEVVEAADSVVATYVWNRPDAIAPKGIYRIEEYHAEEVRRLMRSGRPEIVLDTATLPEAMARNYAALKLGAYVNTPLVREGQWRATLTIGDSTPRAWRVDEIELMRELTTRIWSRVERARAEELVRQSEERYRVFMHHSTEGIYRCELDRLMPVDTHMNEVLDFAYEHTYLAECNDAMARMYGYQSGKELEGVRLGDLTPRTPENEAFLTAFLTNGFKLVGGESHEQHRDGHIVYFRNNLFGIVEDGFLVRVWGTQTDISAQVASEAAIRTEQERARSAEEAAAMGVWETDLVTQQTYFSSGFRVLYGLDPVKPYTMEEAYHVVHPDDVEPGRASFIAAITRHDPEWQSLSRFIHPQHGLRWQFGRSRITYAPDGTPIRVAGTSVDITELHNAEQALRESEELYRLSTEAAAGMLYDFDPRTDRIKRAGAVEAITGVPLADIPERGSWWSERVHPDDLAAYQAMVPDVIAQRDEYFVGEYRVRHAKGHWVHVLDKSRLIYDEAGTLIRMVGNTVDVSDRVRAMSELRESDRRKDEFLATLAHELRNPLAPLRNGLEMLDTITDEPGTVKQVGAMMARQVEHMVHLVNDLLDLCRISRGIIELQLQILDLDEVLRQAEETHGPLFRAKGHTFQVVASPRTMHVEADATRLNQVIGNLLDNACKYTDEGGTITLRAAEENGQAAISVSDTGIGLTADQLVRVFDMFTQVDRADTRSRSGLGIGLHIVQRVVELHGGSITASSDGPGKGSTFTLRLPLKVARPRQVVPSGTNGAKSVPLRILIADDNSDAAHMLGLLLVKSGHAVTVVGSGQEALDKIPLVRPEVVLLDIGMPGMNGHETCRRLRATQWGKETCVIALTGWGQEEDRRRSREAGFDHHLVKPVDLSALNAALRDRLPVRQVF